MIDMTNNIETRLLDIFDDNQDVPRINEIDLQKYFIKLKSLIPKKMLVTGVCQGSCRIRLQ